MEYVTVGVIVNTHGLKGMVKVKSYTEFFEERYQKGMTLYIAFKHEMIPVTVVSYKSVKGLELIQFEEFDDINQCERYKGCDLLIDQKNIHELNEDEFYFSELIGMEVYADALIGVCTDVRELPNGELLVVKTDDKDVLIPFNKEFIKAVDKTKKRIDIIVWEGLL